MGDERIEREIVIKGSSVRRLARRDRTGPDHPVVRRPRDARGRPGRTGEPGLRPSRPSELDVRGGGIEHVVPPRLFSFRWVHPEGETPAPGNSLLVEFTLTPIADEQTLLPRGREQAAGPPRVVHGREGALPGGPPLGMGHPPRAAGAVDVEGARIPTDGVSPETGDEVWSADRGPHAPPRPRPAGPQQRRDGELAGRPGPLLTSGGHEASRRPGAGRTGQPAPAPGARCSTASSRSASTRRPAPWCRWRGTGTAGWRPSNGWPSRLARATPSAPEKREPTPVRCAAEWAYCPIR